ncbi:MAG: winged helix-turn-helix domain-containing protein [Prevotellaceae bacterium]|nr:winged helix-turn-helix domain-containing protein [Prevotellaceae bacterium]
MKEKAGLNAGCIWETLNGTSGMTMKELKKATKLIEKELYLGLGWLLREDKVEVSETESNELFVHLI